LTNFTRRQALFQLGKYALSTIAFNHISTGLLNARPLVPDWKDSHMVLSDLHVHPTLNKWLRNSPGGRQYPLMFGMIGNLNKTNLDWERCWKSGINMLCAAHFNPLDEFMSMPTDLNPDAPRQTIRMLDMLEEEINQKASDFAKIVRNANELKKAIAIKSTDDRFRIAVVHTLEGGHALGGDIGFLEILAKRGVAMIGITHFFTKGVGSSANSLPFFPDHNALPPVQGLTELGCEMIQEMEKLGIIVDIAHATSTTLTDILYVSKKPLIASHISARTLGEHPYSLYDEHIKEVARRGGIIGVILMPYWLSNYSSTHMSDQYGSLKDTVRTIRHIYKICGSYKCIGIGSDFAGFISGPKEMSKLSEIHKLREMLMDEFSDEKIVEGIMAKNVADFFVKNWGNKSTE
jgi:membrane dipeptidase